MAFLLDTGTKRFIPLAPHHTFGRLANRVDTFLNKPYISKLHTTIEWRDQQWFIKNLGRNGTQVNGALLSEHQSLALSLGDEIHFAEPNDPAFVVQDLSAPCDMLWPMALTQKPSPIYLERYHLLPSEDAPKVTLFHDNQQWFMEAISQRGEQAASPLRSGQIIDINGEQWQLLLADAYGPTEARAHHSQNLQDFEFIFELSQDEESTHLTLAFADQPIDLGVRSHHYLLLQLARHRMLDSAQGIAETEQGWLYTEQLMKELGLDETHINIHIFRARKQFSDALPKVNIQQSLIERRGGKLRIGCEKFVMYKAGQLLTPTAIHYQATDQRNALNH